MKKVLLAAAALSLAGAAAPALSAGPQPGAFSLTVFGGNDMPTSGNLHGGAVAPVPDLGPLNPALAGVAAELRIGARTHDDIYGSAPSLGLEFGYGLSDRAELFGQVRWTESDDSSARVGGAFVPALGTELSVFGTFSDYSTLSAEIGYRYFFLEPVGARPFVAGRLGATRTDAISATFTIPDGGITIANAPLYEKSWQGSAGLDVGVLVPVGERFSITAQAGLRYVDNLDGDDSAIGGLGLASINDTGRRISVPLSLAARFDF